MYWQVFARRGLRIQVWLRQARIRYLEPAASDLTLQFSLGEDDIDSASEGLAREGKFVRSFRTEARDRRGRVCAVIENEIYLRLPREDQRDLSAF
jgi:hypothetical protein